MNTSEKGHAKNLANAKLINSYITQLDKMYKPSNPGITKDTLQSIYEDALALHEKVSIALSPYKVAVTEREVLFVPLSKQVTKLKKAYKSTEGVSAAQLDDFMTYARKIKGMRKTPKSQPDNPQEEAASHSVSQMSYDQRTNSFSELIDFLETTPNYAPNEEEFSISTLKSQKDVMRLATEKVTNAFIPLNMARTDRNRRMYTDTDNLVGAYKTAKEYLLSILETGSTMYKAVQKISFTKLAARKS